MGFGIKELLVILVIIILLFGTKKLKNLGTDLGSAIKGFRKSVSDDGSNEPEEKQPEQLQTEAGSESTTTETKDEAKQ